MTHLRDIDDFDAPAGPDSEGLDWERADDDLPSNVSPAGIPNDDLDHDDFDYDDYGSEADEDGFDAELEQADPSYESLVAAKAETRPVQTGYPPAPGRGTARDDLDRENVRAAARQAAHRFVREDIAPILPHALQQSGLLAYRGPAERRRLLQAMMRALATELPVCAARLLVRNGAPQRQFPVRPVLACTSSRLARRFRSELTKQDTDGLIEAVLQLIPDRPITMSTPGSAQPPSQESARPAMPVSAISASDLEDLRQVLSGAVNALDRLIAKSGAARHSGAGRGV